MELSKEGTGDDALSNFASKQSHRERILEEVKKQLWLAGPLIISNLLQICVQLISVMFVGHLGELALSGASMATSFARVTGFSLMIGMSGALETLCGQSYGAKQYHMLGIHMQRAILILLLACIPVSFLFAYTQQILIAVGQDTEISQEAGKYAKFMIPSLFAYALLQPLIKFLQTQNIVFPILYSSAVASLLHIMVCWGLVFKSGLGSRGAALATAISYWINVILLVLYVKLSSSCSNTWTGFSREASYNVLSFITLAIPSTLMLCLELWCFEMMIILSGLLPNPTLETSILSISVITTATVWMIPFGFSGAVSTRVSNELGAGNSMAARLAVRVVMIMAIVEGIVVGGILILIRNVWGYAFSNNKEEIKYVSVMMPILAASNLVDGIQCVLSGVARGCGWQKLGAFVNLAAYYIVGIPSAFVLGFVLHIGGKGLWLGIICAIVIQVLCLLIITLRTNWEQEVNKAAERVLYS